MIKSDNIKAANKGINNKKDKKVQSDSTSKEKKLKELEYLLQCASAECGW